MDTKIPKECLKRPRENDKTTQKSSGTKKTKKNIKKQLKPIQMDLIRDKKIERVNMSFKEWLEDTDYEYFYVFRCQGEYEYIVWKGLDKLNQYEDEHFNTFIQDYLVFNRPDYTLYDEMSETQHGFEDNDLSYHVHARQDY